MTETNNSQKVFLELMYATAHYGYEKNESLSTIFIPASGNQAGLHIEGMYQKLLPFCWNNPDFIFQSTDDGLYITYVPQERDALLNDIYLSEKRSGD